MSGKSLCDQMSVGPQIALEDLPEIAAAGFRTVVSCRPDGEEEGQLTAAQIAEAAAAQGLAFAHVPVVPGQLGPEQAAAFDAAIAELPQPVFGFCRTGARASMLWALNRCGCGTLDADAALGRAADAGYDISALRPRLEAKAS